MRPGLREKNGTFSGIGLANVFPAPRWGRHNFFLRWLVQTEVQKKRVKKLISSWRSIHSKLKTFLKIGQNSFLAKDLLRISRFSLQTVCKGTSNWFPCYRRAARCARYERTKFKGNQETRKPKNADGLSWKHKKGDGTPSIFFSECTIVWKTLSVILYGSK